MSRITAFWNRSWTGKVTLTLLGFIVACCVLGAIIDRNAPRVPQMAIIRPGLAPTPATAQPTAVAASAAEPATAAAPEPTEIPATAAPTDTPEPPTATPAPTLMPTELPTEVPTVTSAPIQNEPSRGLGMSRAVWEAKVGAPIGKGILGPQYQNGVEAALIDDMIWRIDYDFPKINYPEPSGAYNVGKLFLPNDAKLIETYHPDAIMTVHLYHSEWLKGRFPVMLKGTKLEMWVGGEPGDFTLQYDVFDGKVRTLIIAIGNNP